MAHFFVAIAYNKGVILCKKYHETLTAESFGEFVRFCFSQTFEWSKNLHGKPFLQDGDTRQVSQCVKVLRMMLVVAC